MFRFRYDKCFGTCDLIQKQVYFCLCQVHCSSREFTTAGALGFKQMDIQLYLFFSYDTFF